MYVGMAASFFHCVYMHMLMCHGDMGKFNNKRCVSHHYCDTPVPCSYPGDVPKSVSLLRCTVEPHLLATPER